MPIVAVYDRWIAQLGTVSLLLAPYIFLYMPVVLIVAIVFTKKLMISRFVGHHPFYGLTFIKWNLMRTMIGLLSQFCVPYYGTPIMCLFLKCLGVDIHVNCYWATAIPTELDVLHIKRRFSAELESKIIGHLVDNGRLQFAPVNIGENVSLCARSVVMPGSNIENGVVLSELAVCMKGETLTSNKIWSGNPSRVAQEHIKIKHA
jgi:hypothetical protein